MTAADKSMNRWTGETGYINAEKLERFVGALESAIYYIAGPVGMVSAMRATLADAGVDEAAIRAEEFAGY